MTLTTRCLALALITGIGLPSQAADKPVTRPNIVLIVSDDHSVPHLGAYGFPVPTPNFDRFAAAGMTFNRMFTTAPQCAPSRASFATGRSSVAVQASRFAAGVPREIEMFPQILRREAGYYTGIIRRAHHLDGWTNAANTLIQGIWKKHNIPSVAERFDRVDMGGDYRQTASKIDAFFAQAPKDRPFFLWVNFNDPHHPWNAPAVVAPAKLPLPPDWPDTPEMRADFGRYLDEIVRMDTEFQVVLDKIEARGVTAHTIVIFVGDNGLALPRGKGSLYDRGINVPLLVRWPGHIAPGSRSSALVSGEDFAPTLLEAAGLPVPAKITGRSILPLLTGDPAYRPREHIFAMRGVHGSPVFDENARSNDYDLSRAIRSDRYKLILNYTPWMLYRPVDSYNDPGWKGISAAHTARTLAAPFDRLYFGTPRPIVELYDLQADPGEMHNLAGNPAYAEIEHALKVALTEKMIIDFDYLPLPLCE
ncbi:MAG: sulfatase [Lacunisphaera sp.]|nr:sulfatase [Lacunisphaera sp.]